MMHALPLLAGLTLSPHPSFWWISPLFPIAIALTIYLYRAQRRLISPRIATALTAIRIALILLVAVLFLQPALQWIHTRTSAGELWLLIDQSPSMQSTDPQSSPIERLHWAESLGYLPPSVRPAKPDLLVAAFTAISSELATIRPDSAALSTPATAQQELDHVAVFSTRLTDCAKELDTLRAAIAADASASSAADALDALDRAISTLKSGQSSVKSLNTLRDADAAVNWSTIQTNLTLAGNDLTALAAATDAAFITAHGNDSTVATATARIANTSRSDLAALFLTGIDKRPGISDKTFADLLLNYRVRFATFADNAQTTAAIDPATFPDALRSALSSPANVHSTNITAGLEAISEQIAPGQSAAVIIVTDGRHNLPSDPTEPARLLAARGVHVYGLLVGSHEVSPDAAVDQIDSPDWIYKGDTLHAAALVRLEGLAGQTAHVEFRRNGTLLDTQAIAIRTNQESQRVDFTDTPPDTANGGGGYDYEVHVTEMRGEVNTQNNRSTFRVAIKKDKLYALMIDDRPRWEYRYLAAYLSRDQRLKLQTVLLNPAGIVGVAAPAPVKASPANPRLEAQLLPHTREEWQAFDLIILGDIPPETLSNEQQQFIASAVRDKGTTLITLAGQRHMPEQFANTPLAELFPITLAPQWTPEAIARHTRFGFRPGLAPEGNASVLGQFGLNPDTNANLWSDVPQWYWHSPFTQAKPAASVLWSIPPEADAALPANPLTDVRRNALLATMPIGLGRSLYLASDQTWRLRQVYGTNVHDRFWGQVLRWAVGSDLPAGGKFVRFGASQPTYAEGQPVTLTARILKEDLTPNTGLTFSAIARPSSPQHSEFSTQNSVEAHFIESPDTPGYYRATLGGLPPGDNEISLQGPEVERLLDTDPTVTQKTVLVKILPQLDIERRNMNTDPQLLTRIAQAGGGFSLDAHDADILASHIPAIEHTETTTDHLGLFTAPNALGTRLAHWTFLALFATLLTTEWLLRKHAGLI
jgi:hypothetical protein